MFKRLRHKFGARRCERDGIKFPSKLEADCHRELLRLQSLGLVRLFLRQPTFDLPGGFRHKVDFLVFTADSALFIEAKGKDLAMGRMKRLQVEELYGVAIHVVRGPGALAALIAES